MNYSLNDTAQQLEARIRAQRLLDLPAAWADELVFPCYDGLSLWNLAHSIAQVLGAPLPDSAPLDPAVWGGAVPQGIDRVVFILSDGLGYQFLSRLLAEDAALAQTIGDLTQGRGPLPLTSITPTTTAVALPTLWTARTPVAHAMLGTIMYLREFSVLGDMLSYKPGVGEHLPDTFERWGIPPEQFITVRGLSEQLAEQGIPTHLVLDYRLAGTGLSRILHRGVQHRHTHMSYSDVWLRVGDVLRATAGQRCVVSVYWGAVDSLAHMYGMDNVYVRTEITRQMQQMRDLLADPGVQDGRTLVMIAADHGHYDALQAVHIRKDPRARPLMEALRCGLGGEMRLAYAYVRDGQRQAVIDTLEREFADGITWVEGQAAIEAGLFGPETPHAELLHRIGDVILIPRLNWRVVDESINFPAVSLHGGLTDAEVLVPLLWQRM